MLDFFLFETWNFSRTLPKRFLSGVQVGGGGELKIICGSLLYVRVVVSSSNL